MTSNTSPTISGSSAEVGSSNSMTSGCMASERTIATRCFCPPDSCEGYASALSESPTRSKSSIARALFSSLICFADLISAPADFLRSFSLRICFFSIYSGARVIFSSTVLLLNKLKCWNTIPIFCRWTLMSTFISVRSTPWNRMLPEVGSSMQFRQRKNVLLPEPDGPITTTFSPW